MSEQCRTTSPTALFAVPSDSLTLFANLQTVADRYPIIANSSESHTHPLSIFIDTADYRLLRTGFRARLDQLDQEGAPLQLTVENMAASLAGKVAKVIRQRAMVTAPIATPAVACTLKTWPTVLRRSVAQVLASPTKFYPLFLFQHSHTQSIITAPATNDIATTDTAADAHHPLVVMTLEYMTVWKPTADLRDLNAFVPDQIIATFGQLRLDFNATAGAEQAIITTWLTDQLGLQPTQRTLFEQALLAATLYTPGASGMQPQMLVVDACRLIWRAQLMQILLKEAGVRYSQEREYVHEMRVAIRRARAAAKLYGHFFARQTIRPYLAALRKTGRLLGHVRNLDVTIAKARRSATTEEGKHAPRKLVRAWQAQRPIAHTTLVKWLDSDEYRDFLIDFHRFCTKAAEHDNDQIATQRATPTPRQVRHVIPSLIIECYAAVRCYETLFESTLPIDYPTLHALRIACKHLRYNLEFAEHLLGPEIKGLIKRLKELQELLGDLNDAVVAQELIEEPKKGGALRAYQQTQMQLINELQSQVPAALSTLSTQEFRQQLGQALAYL